MTYPARETIREGLNRTLVMELGKIEDDVRANQLVYGERLGIIDAFLDYLIKRQAFHSDAYAQIKAEKGLGK